MPHHPPFGASTHGRLPASSGSGAEKFRFKMELKGQAMKNKNLSDPSPEEMRAMIARLSPAERATLADPNFITEDEADLIISDRRSDEETFPAEEVLAEFGYQLRTKA
jgi:hypothetical protein